VIMFELIACRRRRRRRRPTNVFSFSFAVRKGERRTDGRTGELDVSTSLLPI
jgi:hypothetical protein